MKLNCPKCGHGLSVSEARVPSSGGWARCPKCGEKFFLTPQGPARPASGPPPGPPAAPPAAGPARDLKLACPKCGRPLHTDAARIPPAGAWTHCPRCGERFFLKPPGQGADLSSPAPAAGPKLAAGDSQARRELLSRLQARSPSAAASAPPPDYDEEVTIFPRAAWSGEACFAAGSLVLALIVLVSFMFFRGSVHHPPPPPPAMAAARLNDSQDLGLIRHDLIGLKRRFVNRRTLRADIEHTGPESRIFKYFLARLEPRGGCAGLARLEIKSEDPARGFRAEAVCLDQDGRLSPGKLELDIKWTQRSAVASFPGHPGTDEVEMFPL